MNCVPHVYERVQNNQNNLWNHSKYENVYVDMRLTISICFKSKNDEKWERKKQSGAGDC